MLKKLFFLFYRYTFDSSFRGLCPRRKGARANTEVAYHTQQSYRQTSGQVKEDKDINLSVALAHIIGVARS